MRALLRRAAIEALIKMRAVARYVVEVVDDVLRDEPRPIVWLEESEEHDHSPHTPVELSPRAREMLDEVRRRGLSQPVEVAPPPLSGSIAARVQRARAARG